MSEMMEFVSGLGIEAEVLIPYCMVIAVAVLIRTAHQWSKQYYASLTDEEKALLDEMAVW